MKVFTAGLCLHRLAGEACEGPCPDRGWIVLVRRSPKGTPYCAVADHVPPVNRHVTDDRGLMRDAVGLGGRGRMRALTSWYVFAGFVGAVCVGQGGRQGDFGSWSMNMVLPLF